MFLIKFILCLILMVADIGNYRGLPSSSLVVVGCYGKRKEFSCYECVTTSQSKSCSRRDLKICKSGRCSKTITKVPVTGVIKVIRRCEPNLDQLFCSDSCDGTPSMACTVCCKENACNAAPFTPQPPTNLTPLSILLPFLHYMYVG